MSCGDCQTLFRELYWIFIVWSLAMGGSDSAKLAPLVPTFAQAGLFFELCNRSLRPESKRTPGGFDEGGSQATRPFLRINEVYPWPMMHDSVRLSRL